MAQSESKSDSWKHAGRGFWNQYIVNMCTTRPVHKLQKSLDYLNRVELGIQFTIGGKSLPFLNALLKLELQLTKWTMLAMLLMLVLTNLCTHLLRLLGIFNLINIYTIIYIAI